MDVARETTRANRDGAFASRWIALAVACPILLVGLPFKAQGGFPVKYIFSLSGLLAALVVVDQATQMTGSHALRQLLGRGSTNREIAEALSLTEWLVKHCISPILDKTGMRDRTQLPLFPLRQGLVKPEP